MAYKQLVLTWLMIAAQLCVVVVGHGRVVICHDATGESHIELVSDASCSALVDGVCEQVVEYQSDKRPGLCADTGCEDELLGFSYTLANSRKVYLNRAMADVSFSFYAQQRSSAFDNKCVEKCSYMNIYESLGNSSGLLVLRSTVLVL